MVCTVVIFLQYIFLEYRLNVSLYRLRPAYMPGMQNNPRMYCRVESVWLHIADRRISCKNFVEKVRSCGRDKTNIIYQCIRMKRVLLQYSTWFFDIEIQINREVLLEFLCALKSIMIDALLIISRARRVFHSKKLLYQLKREHECHSVVSTDI